MGIQNLSGFKHKIIFSYSTKHLPVKDKVRFYYGLKGRKGDAGIVREYRIAQLGKTVLLVPIKFSQDVEEFLFYWKCKFNRYEVLIK